MQHLLGGAFQEELDHCLGSSSQQLHVSGRMLRVLLSRAHELICVSVHTCAWERALSKAYAAQRRCVFSPGCYKQDMAFFAVCQGVSLSVVCRNGRALHRILQSLLHISLPACHTSRIGACCNPRTARSALAVRSRLLTTQRHEYGFGFFFWRNEPTKRLTLSMKLKVM